MRCVPGSGNPITAEDRSAPGAHAPLLEDKLDEVAGYIHAQTHAQHEAENLGLVSDETGDRIVTLLPSTTHYTVSMCRQVSLEGEGVSGTEWGVGSEVMAGELTEEEGLALVAHLTDASQRHRQHKLQMRGDTGVLLEGPMRLLNTHNLGAENGEHTTEIPVIPLHDMKPTVWYSELQEDHCAVGGALCKTDADDSSPAQSKQSRKSLPHKKRISRKLRRAHPAPHAPHAPHTPHTPHLLPCEEILPDSFAAGQQNHQHHAHTLQLRAVLVCQECGEFYGEDQLKFYRHLKFHYEPLAHTIIIENPLPHQPLDKLDSQTPLADSLALGHEKSVYTHKYLSRDVHQESAAYVTQTTESRVAFTDQQEDYSTQDRDSYNTEERSYPNPIQSRDVREKTEYSVEERDSIYKTFRKHKHSQPPTHTQETHISKTDELSEFSEPEDLMEGIHVLVEDGAGGGGGAGGFLTVHNGHVHQDHNKQWYVRDEETRTAGGAAGGGVGAGEGSVFPQNALHNEPCPVEMKEEMLHRILEVEVEVCDRKGGESPPARAAKVPPGPRAARYYECQECERRFKHRNSLVYHIKAHGKERKFKCEYCPMAFITNTSLKGHISTHTDVKPHKCQTCSRAFRRLFDLNAHMDSKHFEKKKFKCDYCGKEFARKYSLNIHIKIHTGVRNYKCELCGKTFRASSYRLAHMRTHTDERPFKCTICSKFYRTNGDLSRHLRTHRPRAAPAPPPHLHISDVRSFAETNAGDYVTLAGLYSGAESAR